MSDSPYFLAIPEDYGRHLGRLRWSTNGDAVEYDDGTTFALVPEIALFLEGLTAHGRLPHFAFVLHLLHLLGKGRSDFQREVVSDIVQNQLSYLLGKGPSAGPRLREAFQETGRPLRNAGAFFAALCRKVPAVSDPFVFQPHEWMVQSSILWLHRIPPHEELPPWTPAHFEAHVLRRLESYTSEDLHHWFRHGRGPIRADAEQLAREIAIPKPRTLAEVLAELAQRDRLAGAVPYVDRLHSALALPPRRLDRQELPVGGYSDVTTRGLPEQILPSQLALDGLEFVRRFAANELLFFRREEPNTQMKEELVLLLDQGVRCWGDVRLVLTAAVFALIKRVARSRIALRLVATSSGGKLLDCRSAQAAALGELLEASDLTAHPALSLERVLEEPAAGNRDIVLLTHPRNLAEADVEAAAHRLGPQCRLFAVTVDGHGQGQLAELRHGVPVPRTRFRIEWEKALPPSPPPAPEAAPSALPWNSNVEPIGFPFRFGVAGPLGPFAFDQSGEWFLVSGARGMLHVERTDGTSPEVLPRGFLNDRVLTDVEVVLGVQDGFVVCGKIDSELVAFHYRLEHRICTARIIGVPESAASQRQWFYFPRYHAVVMREEKSIFGVDLRTGERGYCKAASQAGTAPTRRTCADVVIDSSASVPVEPAPILQACAEAENYLMPPPGVAILSDRNTYDDSKSPVLALDAKTGTIGLTLGGRNNRCFTPLFDGKPLLKGRRIIKAALCGDALAVIASETGWDHSPVYLFRLPEGSFLAEFPIVIGSCALPSLFGRVFALSPDGNKFARLKSTSKIVIHDLTGDGRGNWVTPHGRFHSNVELQGGTHWLAVSVGNFAHVVSWANGILLHDHTSTQGKDFIGIVLKRTGLEEPYEGGFRRTPENLLMYEHQRFIKVTSRGRSGLWMALDGYGQVSVIDQEYNLICMFFAFRDQLAAWMPDGTRLGPATLTGGPATAHAAERIGRALLAAEAGEARPS